jgi:hypothetical protein
MYVRMLDEAPEWRQEIEEEKDDNDSRTTIRV